MFVFLILSIVISVIVGLSSYVLGSNFEDSAKFLPYECGLDAFNEMRQKINIQFYIIAVFFLLVDLEVLFLFPWVAAGCFMSSINILIMALFILMSIICFAYETKRGVLDWD